MSSIFATYFARFETAPQRIFADVSPRLGMIVIIPVYCDPEIFKTLQSLCACSKPQSGVEVIVVVNNGEHASADIRAENEQIYTDLQRFSAENSSTDFKIFPILEQNLPQKHSGVGLARKIAMDEAVRRFAQIGNEQGVILSCDADTLVDENYFIEVEKFYAKNPMCGAANVEFEHPLSGEFPPKQYSAIAQYELHLRYYVQELARIGFPYAFHTVGSSFTVRAKTYCRQGGMNKRQGGEDFYFLQKLFPAEQFGVICTTKTHPSARVSARAPFGTGFAMCGLMAESEPTYLTYNHASFNALQVLFVNVRHLQSFDSEQFAGFMRQLYDSLQDFLLAEHFEQKIVEIRKHSASTEQFCKRFFNWFNGFMVIKYINAVHRTEFSKVPVVQAVSELLGVNNVSAFELLEKLREM